jgi:predicted Zn-dependent protease
MLATTVAQLKSEYVLALQGSTWDHSTITVLIVAAYNESWWNPAYLNASLRAISEWNGALSYFASNNSDFDYLSRLRMTAQVSNVTENGFDEYISWIEQFGNETCEAGLSRTTYMPTTNLITKNEITLSAYDCRGNILSETDEQNVALHELGHCLGLGHANYTDDLMYYAYSLGGSVRAISTLDTYGVGTVFRWMAYSQEYSPDNQGQPVYSVSLTPSGYEYQPISDTDLPPQSTLEKVGNFFDDFIKFVLQPEVLVLFIIAVSALVGYLAISIIRRKTKGADEAILRKGDVSLSACCNNIFQSFYQEAAG